MLVLVFLVRGILGSCEEHQIENYGGGDCIDCRVTNCKTCFGGAGCSKCKDGFKDIERACNVCAKDGEIFANGKCVPCQAVGAVYRDAISCQCQQGNANCCHAQSGAGIVVGAGDGNVCGSCWGVEFGCKKCDRDNCLECADGFKKVAFEHKEGHTCYFDPEWKEPEPEPEPEPQLNNEDDFGTWKDGFGVVGTFILILLTLL